MADKHRMKKRQRKTETMNNEADIKIDGADNEYIYRDKRNSVPRGKKLSTSMVQKIYDCPIPYVISYNLHHYHT